MSKNRFSMSSEKTGSGNKGRIVSQVAIMVRELSFNITDMTVG